MPFLEADEIVHGQGVAHFLQRLAALNDFPGDFHRFQHLEDELVARHHFDGVAQQHACVEVDEAEVGSERLLDAQFIEDVAQHRGRGGEIVADLGAVLPALAKEQFVGVKLIPQVENRLAANEYVVGGAGGCGRNGRDCVHSGINGRPEDNFNRRLHF